MSRTTKSHKTTKHQTSLESLNQVRIIGGHFKRRNISFMNAEGLRPTPDRLRETLFNWLMSDIFHAQVLDVCAGSGVLGFESLSRGAAHVTCIEPNTKQASLIKHNADNLKLTNQELTIINSTAEQALPTLSTAFDVIFIDPPYTLDIWSDIIHAIMAHRLCHADTLFYIESDKPPDDILSPFTITLLKNTKVGQVHAGVFTLHDTSHTA